MNTSFKKISEVSKGNSDLPFGIRNVYSQLLDFFKINFNCRLLIV